MNKKITLAAFGCLMAATCANAAEPGTEVEGKVKTYTKTFTAWSFGMLTEPQTQEDVEIVFGDNGEVYFKDFTSESDTYIKGVREGNRITVELPQLDYNDGFSDNILNLLVKTDAPEMFADFADVWYGVSYTEEIKTAVFNIASDGTITWDNPDNEYALGTVPDPDYSGMGATLAYVSMTFTPDEPDEPEDPELEEPITDVEGETVTYSRTFKGWSFGMLSGEETEEDVEIVFGENGEVYFKDFTSESDTYIKGTKDGNKITLKLPQIDYNDGYSDHILHLLVKMDAPDMFADFAEVWYGVTGNDEPETVVFTVGEDGSITWDNPDEEYALGTVPDPDYMGYGASMAFVSMKYIPDNASGVAGIENTEVKDVVYYNLNGQRISKPASSGLYIRVSELKGGKKKTEKMLLK